MHTIECDRGTCVNAAEPKFVKHEIGSASWNPPTVATDPETGQGRPFSTYVYATQIAEVDVVDETGEAGVLRMVEVHDCGTAIKPMLG